MYKVEESETNGGERIYKVEESETNGEEGMHKWGNLKPMEERGGRVVVRIAELSAQNNFLKRNPIWKEN